MGQNFDPQTESYTMYVDKDGTLDCRNVNQFYVSLPPPLSDSIDRFPCTKNRLQLLNGAGEIPFAYHFPPATTNINTNTNSNARSDDVSESGQVVKPTQGCDLHTDV